MDGSNGFLYSGHSPFLWPDRNRSQGSERHACIFISFSTCFRMLELVSLMQQKDLDQYNLTLPQCPGFKSPFGHRLALFLLLTSIMKSFIL